MNVNEQIIEVIVSYLKGEITPVQETILNNWINLSDKNKQLFDKISNSKFLSEQLLQYQSFDKEKIWNNLQSFLEQKNKHLNRKVIWLRWAAAAVFAGLIVGFAFYFNKQKQQMFLVSKKQDINAPVLSKAYIKMDNGQVLMIDSIKPNVVFKLNGVEVMKNELGQIFYPNRPNEKTINTLFNPQGSNIVTLVLSDGTKVWLNNESSITYPIQFDGDSTRTVNITGEAYFEVAKSKTQKFVVISNSGVKTQVLGTHFNIKSYADESASYVTLLEGSVQVSKAGKQVLLTPRQQLLASIKGENIFLVKEVSVEKIVSWKNGLFDFEDDDIYSITKQLSRWYNIDIQISGNFSADTYSGIISRNLSLMQVLQILKLAGVNYRENEKTLTIIKT
jgi:transmembrane sensor